MRNSKKTTRKSSKPRQNFPQKCLPILVESFSELPLAFFFRKPNTRRECKPVSDPNLPNRNPFRNRAVSFYLRIPDN